MKGAEVYLTIGISGSGKTTFGNKLLQDNKVDIVVCPDDLRKEITGSIDNQSQNKIVFDTAYLLLEDYLKQGLKVYFSATSLNMKSIRQVKKISDRTKATLKILLFEDSLDWKLCQRRVEKDIIQGIERSNTLIIRNNMPLIEEMSERYKQVKDLLEKDLEFKSILIFYVKEGSLY